MEEKRVRIIGTVFVVGTTVPPSALLKWFLEWKKAQILTPALIDLAETAHKTADAITKLAKVMREAHLEALKAQGLQDGNLPHQSLS